MVRNFVFNYIVYYSGPNVINPSDFFKGLKGIIIIIINIELQLSHAFPEFQHIFPPGWSCDQQYDCHHCLVASIEAQ